VNRYEVIAVVTVEAKDERSAKIEATAVLAEGFEGVTQNYEDDDDAQATRYRVAGVRRLKP
jgi:hypothetical protein